MASWLKNTPFFSSTSDTEGSYTLNEIKNLYTITYTTLKLFLDAKLRDINNNSKISNDLLICFITSLLTCIKNQIKARSLICTKPVWGLIIDSKNELNQESVEIIETISQMKKIIDDDSRAFAFICLLIMAKKLSAFLIELTKNRKNLNKFYQTESAFIFTEEMKVLIGHIKALDLMDINIDINSMDYKHKFFHELDLNFLFQSCSFLSLDKNRDSLNIDNDTPRLLEIENPISLLNQKSYIEETSALINEKNKLLSQENSQNFQLLQQFVEENKQLKMKNNTLTSENEILTATIADNKECTQKYSEQIQELRSIITDLRNDKSIAENLSNDRKHSLDAALTNCEVFRADLNILNIEIESVKKSRSELEQKLIDQNHSINQLNTENFNLKEEIGSNKLLLNELMDQLKKANDMNKLHQVEITKLNESVKELTAELESNRNYSKELEIALEEMGDTYSRKTLEMENLKEDTIYGTAKPWTDDGAVQTCQGCNELFTLARRRHHCRKCGRIFCKACSSNTAVVKEGGAKQRVCDKCFGILLHISCRQ